MIRKLIVCTLILLSSAALPASDFSIRVGGLESHRDLIGGFLPTKIEAGGAYTGITLIPGNRSAIEFLVGGGYMSRDIWKDQDGMELAVPSDTLTIWTGTWEVLFSQGFLRWNRTGKDFLTLYGGIRGQVEFYPDTEEIEYFSKFDPPESGGILTNMAAAGIILDGVSMNGIVPRGLIGEAKFLYAPGWLLNTLYGSSSFSALQISVIGYQPLFSLDFKNGKNLVSMYFANRLQGDIIFSFDDELPLLAQDEPSLGTKMRGLERYTRAGSVTVVNNFDIRVSGPELFVDKLYPRLHLFTDVGYTDGKNANGASDGTGEMFASSGAEAGISFFDFFNLGYRVTRMLFGSNMLDEPLVQGVYMSLQF